MRLLTLSILACLFASPALAQPQGVTGERPTKRGPPQFVALGVGTTTKFAGASNYKLIPFGGARISAPGGTLLVQGPGLIYSVKLSDSIEAGPLIQYAGSRKPDTGDALINSLDPIGTSLDLGGFITYNFAGIGGPANQFDIGLQAKQDVLDGHGGFRLSGSIGHSWRWRSGMFVRAGLGLSFADGTYMNRNFGITAANSITTGLPTYSPGAGLEDVNVSAVFNVPVSGPWSIFGRAAYAHLLSKAANSPWVSSRGSSSQIFAGLSLGYRF
jgi:MipA family protein